MSTTLAGKTILVIDDADDMRMLVRKILEVDGAVVEESSDIKSGLELAKVKAPHLIVLDLNLPGLSGFDFLETRKNASVLSDIPTLVLSGMKDKASVQKAISLGATDYAIKPFRASLFLQKVRKALKLSSFHSLRIAESDPASHAILSFPCEVVKINEIGCVIGTHVRLGSEEELKIKSDFLEEIGIRDVLMRTVSEPAKYLDVGQYSSEINFIGISRELSNKIRAKMKGGR